MRKHSRRQPQQRSRKGEQRPGFAPIEETEAPAQSLERLRQPHAGAGQRGSAALGLQRAVGNAAVARELGTLQRYPVGAATNASCAEVIQWVDGNSPYAPEWAHTQVKFKWGGSFKITGNDKDGYKLSVSNASVTMTKSVDMPEWQPSGRAMRSAWQQAYTTLRAHEARHEAIGARWKAELLARLKALSLDVSDKNQDATTSASMVQAEWDTWIAEHQADQDAIDPFTATLNCPVAEAEPPGGDGDSAAGTDGDGASAIA